jgi:hypothetical protein
MSFVVFVATAVAAGTFRLLLVLSFEQSQKQQQY